MNIYQIKNEYLKLFDMLDDPECDQDSLKLAIDDMKEKFETKVSNCAAYIKNLESQVDAMKEYEKNMKRKREAMEANIEKIKEYLLKQMKEAGVQSVTGEDFLKIKIKKCPPALEIFDYGLIDKRYITTTIVEKINNGEIKEALKNGENVEGAKLIQREILNIS